jgi:DNA-directed RNA polymerase specialized sigma24 family protein
MPTDDGPAEIVAQDPFTELGGGGALPQGQVKQWPYKAARNRCLDNLRRQRRSPTHGRPIRADDGNPLFAMELVDGRPLTEFVSSPSGRYGGADSPAMGGNVRK